MISNRETNLLNDNNIDNSSPSLNQPLRLSELAFNALLRNSHINLYSQEYDLYKSYKFKHDILPFLESIANANPKKAKKFLVDLPELVLARGTIKTVSGNTYKNHSAIELAFVMDDHELMRDVLFPAILQLPPEQIKKAEAELTNKMAEIEEQRVHFQSYNFSKIADAITKDESIKFKGKASEETKEILENLKNDFAPKVISQGKSWIPENLRTALQVIDKHVDNPRWTDWQFSFFFMKVIGHVQTRAEKCFEQECSQGLYNIVEMKQSNNRSTTVKSFNGEYKKPLTYRGSEDLSLILGQNFHILITDGVGTGGLRVRNKIRDDQLVKKYIDQKNQQWELLRDHLVEMMDLNVSQIKCNP